MTLESNDSCCCNWQSVLLGLPWRPLLVVQVWQAVPLQLASGELAREEGTAFRIHLIVFPEETYPERLAWVPVVEPQEVVPPEAYQTDYYMELPLKASDLMAIPSVS